jgi:hypothetical protein
MGGYGTVLKPLQLELSSEFLVGRYSHLNFTVHSITLYTAVSSNYIYIEIKFKNGH